MRKLVLVVAACLLATTAFAQQLKTAQGITIETYTPAPEPEPKKILPIEKGFEQSVELGAGPALDDDLCFLSAEYIAGYRFNDIFFVGGGTGIDWEVSEGSLAIPLYATTRAYILPKSRWQPFFGLSLGTVFRVSEFDDWGYNHKDVGLHLNPSIGVNYRINQKYSCYCAVGYMYRDMVYSYGDYDHNKYDQPANCLSIKLGFTF